MVKQIAWILALLATLGTATSVQAADELVVYSGRSKGLVQPLVEQFEKETGIKVQVRYGETAELAVALAEEGVKSPADVFWSQDAGALGAIDKMDLLAPLSSAVFAGVTLPERFRNASGTWVATSGRVRVIAYSPERVPEDQIPTSVFDLTDPRWKGKVGWAPTNASFQSFVTAMRVLKGEEATEAWLQGMKANEPKSYPKNTPILAAIAAGEIDLGLPNHYYLLRFKTADGSFAAEQTFFADGDVGNLLNIAGAGVLKSSKNSNADKFIAFLLSPRAQQYFASEVLEYPVTEGIITSSRLVSMERLLQAAPQVNLGDLDDLEGTLAMMRRLGIL